MARLNTIEFLAMNNPARRALQRNFEFPKFVEMLSEAGISLRGKKILDAGCGSGYGLELIQREFKPSRLVGFDLMPEQVERANKRGIPGAQARVGDITKIDEPDGGFDAVFVFGILHHVPAWRQGLREISRVLAPGGVFLNEEIHGTAVRVQDRLFGTSHPREAAFSWPEYRDGMREAGLEVLAERQLVWEAARSFLARKR